MEEEVFLVNPGGGTIPNPFAPGFIEEVWREFKARAGEAVFKQPELWKKAFEAVRKRWEEEGKEPFVGWYPAPARNPEVKEEEKATLFNPPEGAAGALAEAKGKAVEFHEKYLLGVGGKDLLGVVVGVATAHYTPQIFRWGVPGTWPYVAVQGLASIVVGHLIHKMTGDVRMGQMAMIGGFTRTIMEVIKIVSKGRVTLAGTPALMGEVGELGEEELFPEEEELFGEEELLPEEEELFGEEEPEFGEEEEEEEEPEILGEEDLFPEEEELFGEEELLPEEEELFGEEEPEFGEEEEEEEEPEILGEGELFPEEEELFGEEELLPEEEELFGEEEPEFGEEEEEEEEPEILGEEELGEEELFPEEEELFGEEEKPEEPTLLGGIVEGEEEEKEAEEPLVL